MTSNQNRTAAAGDGRGRSLHFLIDQQEPGELDADHAGADFGEFFFGRAMATIAASRSAALSRSV
ncbi:MAG: hypothetical protein HC829_07545 [Bacteroidales bacterium]|nr:hypothetical protein [Bacteroidales bacterium]